MIDIYCHLDKMSNDQERKPLGPSVRDFLEYVYWERPTLFVGSFMLRVWILDQIKEKRPIE